MAFFGIIVNFIILQKVRDIESIQNIVHPIALPASFSFVEKETSENCEQYQIDPKSVTHSGYPLHYHSINFALQRFPISQTKTG